MMKPTYDEKRFSKYGIQEAPVMSLFFFFLCYFDLNVHEMALIWGYG